MNNFSNMFVLQSFKLNYYDKIYHSNENGKKNIHNPSRFVKFVLNNNECHGEIDYFINYDGLIYCCVSLYNLVHLNLFSDFKGRISKSIKLFKLNHYFDRYFQILRKTEHKILICPSTILYKCIIFKINNSDFIFIDYLNDDEHD